MPKNAYRQAEHSRPKTTTRKLSSLTSLGRTRLQEGLMFESEDHNPLTDTVVLGLSRLHCSE